MGELNFGLLAMSGVEMVVWIVFCGGECAYRYDDRAYVGVDV